MGVELVFSHSLALFPFLLKQYPKSARWRTSVSFFSWGRFMFSQMDKFQHWVASRDVAWAKLIGLANVKTFKLMPIKHPVIKELL
jgi:hypothetical protein